MKRTLSEKDLDLIETRLKGVFVTKEEFMEYKSEHFDKLDKIIKYTEDKKQEITVISHRQRNHSDRIEKIEKHLKIPSYL